MNRTALLEQRRQEQVKELEKRLGIESHYAAVAAASRLYRRLHGEPEGDPSETASAVSQAA